MTKSGINTSIEATSLLSKESFAPSFKRTLLSSAVVTGALMATPAYAQNTPAAAELSTITVQGEQVKPYQAPVESSNTKLTAPLLDTPRTVTIISEELIKDRGATSLQDVLRTTPGITLGSGEGGTPTGDRPFIRGYEASTDIFIDGIRDYARGSHETFNVDSVEFIKGPGSVFSGRGATGGSINIVTKAPEKNTFFDVSAGMGNAGQWRTTIDGNYAFSETGAFRLNAMKMGGEVAGRDGVTIDRMGIAPSLAFNLGDATRVVLSYAHIENNDMPDLGTPFKNDTNPGRVTPIKVDRDLFYGRKNVDFRENTFDTATLKVEHKINNDMQLSNTTRYGESLNHYLMTRPSFENCTAAAPCPTEGPGMQFNRKDRALWRQSESFINQTDLTSKFSTGFIKHDVVTGIEFSREEIFSKAVGGLPLPTAGENDDLYNPNPNKHYNYKLTYGPKTSAGHIKTSAVYLIDTLTLSEQWSTVAGVRYDRFTVNNITKERTDSFVNYQLGLVYKPAPNGSIYVSYGTSSNPSGENLGQNGGADGAAGAAQINDLGPEKSRSWELGTKWEVLDRNLTLSAAIFETKKTDARSSDPLGIVTLDGNNRVRGIEFEATGAITPKWDIWAGLSLLDPKVTKYNSSKTSGDLGGKQMKFIAKKSGSVWSNYQVLPQLSVGAGATYVGERFVDDVNVYKLPSHVRYDAMARYDIAKNISLQFNINNISNTEVYDASHVGIFANVGAGRTYMMTLNYRYE